MPVRLGLDMHTYFNQSVFRKLFGSDLNDLIYDPSRTGICMPVRLEKRFTFRVRVVGSDCLVKMSGLEKVLD